jgi:ABC-type antimicrobial peptide transport system permease subunit
MAYVVGTDRNPASVVSEVRAVVRTLDARLPIHDVRPMETYVEAARSTRGFTVLVAALFAIAALVLTTVGVYGVLAYAVALRRHEFGVRRALGADGGHVMREVLREGFGFAIAGCTAGLGVIAIAARFLQSQLYGVPAADPISHAGAIALILCGAAIACWIPAHRATSVSPMEALKTE